MTEKPSKLASFLLSHNQEKGAVNAGFLQPLCIYPKLHVFWTALPGRSPFKCHRMDIIFYQLYLGVGNIIGSKMTSANTICAQLQEPSNEAAKEDTINAIKHHGTHHHANQEQAGVKSKRQADLLGIFAKIKYPHFQI